MNHPKEYTLTRDEWLEMNRVLCGASLSLRNPLSNSEKGRAERRRRYDAVQGALKIISVIYDRAAGRAA